MAKGFRMDRVPVGADQGRWRPGIKRDRQSKEQARQAAFQALPEQEKERRRQAWADHEADMAEWRKDFERVGPDRAGELLQERQAARRALDKIADREARVAVEGDTDLNHDNLEGTADAPRD